MKNVDIIGKLTDNLNGEILTFNFNIPVGTDIFRSNDDNFMYIEDMDYAQIQFITDLCYNNYIEMNTDSFCYLEGESFVEKVGDVTRVCTLIAIIKNDASEIEKVMFMKN